MHGRTLALLALAALLLTAAPALGAGAEQRASFNLRVSGTYTSHGQVTNTQCRRLDAEGNSQTYTGTGSTSESTSFSATRSVRFDVSRTRGHARVFGGGLPVPVKAKMKRSSTLEEATQPRGCDLSDHPPAKNCGTKTKPYKLSVFLRRAGGLSYTFSSGFSTTTPDDPFSCPVPLDSDWFAQFDPPTLGGISASKFFNSSLTRLSTSGSRSRTLHPKAESDGYSATVTESLAWKVTLTRRH